MLCRILIVIGLALVLLAGVFGLLAVAVRLAWRQVPPPPAAVTFDDCGGLATRQTYALLRFDFCRSPPIYNTSYG